MWGGGIDGGGGEIVSDFRSEGGGEQSRQKNWQAQQARENQEASPESIEWFIEDQAFLRSYDLAPQPSPSPPLQSESCLSFSVVLRVAGRAYADGRGGGQGAKSKQPQESLVLYKLFDTLWASSCVWLTLFVQREGRDVWRWVGRGEEGPHFVK